MHICWITKGDLKLKVCKSSYKFAYQQHLYTVTIIKQKCNSMIEKNVNYDDFISR